MSRPSAWWFHGSHGGTPFSVVGFLLENPTEMDDFGGPPFPYAPCVQYLSTFGIIWAMFGSDVGKYSIHGAYGILRTRTKCVPNSQKTLGSIGEDLWSRFDGEFET